MVSSLLLPENQEKLIRIPKYHVIPGRLSAMDVGNIAVPQMARTANGQRLPIGIESSQSELKMENSELAEIWSISSTG
jgi:uncharacterized surface protein with fasciclin (FAS1) repeats